jgi:hypothetical protein
MGNTVQPWSYGPFRITWQELPPTGDSLKLLFEVDRNGLSLGSVIAELSRSAARTLGDQVELRARLLARTRARLEGFLDQGGADQLTPGKPIELPRIDSTDLDFIDGFVESNQPSQ